MSLYAAVGQSVHLISARASTKGYLAASTAWLAVALDSEQAMRFDTDSRVGAC